MTYSATATLIFVAEPAQENLNSPQKDHDAIVVTNQGLLGLLVGEWGKPQWGGANCFCKQALRHHGKSNCRMELVPSAMELAFICSQGDPLCLQWNHLYSVL